MQRLVETVNEYFPQWPFILVFGASADKSMGDMLSAILPRCELVITTQSRHPRAATPEELKAKVDDYSIPVIAVNPVEEALSQALSHAGETKGILVTGSIFIAAAARAIWSQLEI